MATERQAKGHASRSTPQVAMGNGRNREGEVEPGEKNHKQGLIPTRTMTIRAAAGNKHIFRRSYRQKIKLLCTINSAKVQKGLFQRISGENMQGNMLGISKRGKFHAKINLRAQIFPRLIRHSEAKRQNSDLSVVILTELHEHQPMSEKSGGWCVFRKGCVLIHCWPSLCPWKSNMKSTKKKTF